MDTKDSIENSSNNSKAPPWEKIAGFIFGLVFITALLTLVVVIPTPTPTQYVVFKTVLALAAAGIGGILAGFLHVEGKMAQMTTRAGGAFALFILVFFFSPAPPVSNENSNNPSDINQEMNGDGIQIGVVEGELNIGTKREKAEENKTEEIKSENEKTEEDPNR